MKNLVIVLGAGVLAGGCGLMPARAPAPVAPLQLEGKTLAFTQHQPPEFIAIQPPKGTLGSMLAMLELNPGDKNNDIIWRNQIPDPALAITADVAGALKARYRMTVLPNPIVGTPSKPAALAAVARGRADYVLDIQTTLWRTAYIGSSWARYYVEHKAEAQLIDARDGKVLAARSCNFAGRDKPNPPTWDELVGNNAARLKQELAGVAVNCSDVIKEMLLKSPA